MKVSPVNILLIDDDYYFYKLLRPELKYYDIECLHSNNFNLISCYDQLRSSAGVVVDFHLLPRNGIEIAEEIKRYYPSLEVFIVSADCPAAVVSEKISDWIVKAAGVKQIATRIIEGLSGSKG